MIPKSDSTQLWKLLQERNLSVAHQLGGIGLRCIFDVYSAEYKRITMPHRLDVLDLYASVGVDVNDLQHPFVTFMGKFGYDPTYATSVYCHGVSAITDYLLKIRNLSPLERLALEGNSQ